MVGLFRTTDQARQRFDEYARLEPELERLWELCANARPPGRVVPDDDDDAIAPDDPAREPSPDEPPWSSEDYFLETIKPRLCELVGWDRRGGPPELRTATAYDEVYSALFHHALAREPSC